ncbi:MAG: hypothetical protein K9G64_00270 [Bacteroidia bacterium]|jgi:hypothetical protein|nr:hypothetical protein [Bacteroidia bacterium]
MKTKLIYFSVFLILLSSCGSSLIKVTGNSRPYSVYIDNQYKGMTNNDIKFQRSGLPQKKLIEIKDISGKVIAQQKISRNFNTIKFIVGLVYFYPILFFCWDYDKKIEIQIDNSNNNSNTSPWDEEKPKSPWD